MSLPDLEHTWLLLVFVASALRSSNRRAQAQLCPVTAASGACPVKRSNPRHSELRGGYEHIYKI